MTKGLRNTFRSARLATGIATMLLSCALHAQVRSFNIPSGDLKAAIDAYVAATGQQIVYKDTDLKGRQSKGAQGAMTPEEALDRLLEGTSMQVKRDSTGPVVVYPAAVKSQSGASASAAGMAAADGALAAGVSALAVGELQKVEVTGSRLKRIDAEGAVPVSVYTREDIAKSGQASLQRFLASLNEVSVSSGEGGFSNTLGQGTVQLRGLPLGSTLVLVNGRKVQAVGSSIGSVFNLNLIPLAAVERVEVVPQGSSAVYGGDALAGVVNVILKKSINGFSFATNAGGGSGFGDGSMSLATGGQDADGQFLLMGSYSRSSPLTMRQRDFFLNADYRSIGGADGRSGYCTPGTVRSVSGNLPGLNSSLAGIPPNAGQLLTVADFQATAGSENRCGVYTTGTGTPLLYGYKTLSIHALGERKLSGSWSAFTEITYVRDRMEGGDRGILLFGETVPASNPFNPFGVAVRVTSALGAVNGTDGLSRQTDFTRALVGAKGELGAGWDAEFVLSTASDRGGSQTWNDRTNSTALAAALASADPATALNPFTTGRAASDTVLRQIWSDVLRRSVGRRDQISAQVRGTLVNLPAGPMEAVLGAEAARDVYDVTTSTVTNAQRSSSAIYAETRAPLLRSSNDGGGSWDLAALTVAARNDRYSDFGAANTFQGGLELRPSRSLLIRGSAATSFKPPTLVQTHVTDRVFNLATLGYVDPARGGELITSGTVVRGSNPDLMPEHGQARSVGAVWEPEGGLGTRVGFTYWQTRIRDMIGVLTPQAVLNAEALFPQFVTRGPAVNGQPGVITNFKYTEVNFGRLDTAGTDLDLAYVLKVPGGKLTLSAGASHTTEYSVQLTPGSAVESRLGRRFSDYWSPRWKARVGVSIDQGAWSLGVSSRYLGSYLDVGTSTRTLGDYWMHDLAGTLDVKKMWPDLLPGFKTASLGVSIANLTNVLPQYADNQPYYDVTQADWRGRYASVRLTLNW